MKQICFLFAATVYPRISPEQQVSRFQSRAKRVIYDITPSLKQLPEDSLQQWMEVEKPAHRLSTTSAPGASTVSGEVGNGGGDAQSQAPEQIPDDEDEDEKEALLLGIPAADRKRRKMELTGPRAKSKRSKDEILNDEADKCAKDLSEMLDKLVQWPLKPTGYDVGRLDRSISACLRKMKEASSFDNVAKLEKLKIQVDCIRDCMAHGAKYLPAKGLPNKKHLENFYSSFRKAETEAPPVLLSFPTVVQQHYLEASVTKDIDEKKWDRVAAHISKEKLEKIYPDAEAIDKQAVGMMEQVLASIMGTSDADVDAIRVILKEACESMLLQKPADVVASQIPLLVQLADMNPQGQATLDGMINAFHDQAEKPIMRVVMSSDAGRKLVQAAEDQNVRMQEKASKLTTLVALKDFSMIMGRGVT